jgi:transcriptional regulator with XRE-family HTH domain
VPSDRQPVTEGESRATLVELLDMQKARLREARALEAKRGFIFPETSVILRDVHKLTAAIERIDAAPPSSTGRTRGAAMLAARAERQQEIADAIGMSRSAVANFATGAAIPTPTTRAQLATLYGIPVGSWTQPVTTTARSKARNTAKTAKADAKALSGGPSGGKAAAAALVRHLDAQRREAEERGEDNKALRLTEMQRRAIVDYARLNGELSEGEEARLTRSQKWISLRSRILDALAPFPDAIRAVIAALQEAEA